MTSECDGRAGRPRLGTGWWLAVLAALALVSGQEAVGQQPCGDPEGWYRCSLPDGWTLRESTADIRLYGSADPGDPNAFLALARHGRLSLDHEGLSAEDVLRRSFPQVGELLRNQGVRVTVVPEPRSRRVGGLPAAVAEAPGRAADGRQVRVWFGGVLEGRSFVSVLAVVTEGSAAARVPEVESFFSSLRLTPPARNEALERSLVGRSFSSSTYTSAGALYTSYAFGPAGRLRLETMSNLSVGGESSGHDAATSGVYEVFGESVFMSFADGSTAVGRLRVQSGRIVALQIGDQTYR